MQTLAHERSSPWSGLATHHMMTSPDLESALPSPTEADALLPPSKLPTSSAHRRSEQSPPPFHAFAWIGMAALCFSIMAIAIRLSSTRFAYSTSASLLLRSVAHLILSSTLLVSTIRVSPLDLPPSYRRLLMIRGLFGTVAIVFGFKALSYLPAGEASSLFACSPILTMILSKLILKEASNVCDVLCALIALLGVWLIAGPEKGDADTAQHVLGASLALLEACFSAAGFVCVRGMGTRVHFMLSVFALGIIGTPVTAFLGGHEAIHQILSNHRGTAVMLLGSLSGFGAQSCLNKGLQSRKAGQSIIMKNLEVPFIYILGLLVLGEKSSAPRILGSVLVVSAVVIISLRSQKMGQS